jgi:hypothetical protein
MRRDASERIVQSGGSLSLYSRSSFKSPQPVFIMLQSVGSIPYLLAFARFANSVEAKSS